MEHAGMSDDIQKETERIHQGIVESLSFSDALAKRDAEIERLREGYEQCRATLKHVAADRDQKETEAQCLRDRLLPYIDYADGVPAGYGEDEIDRQRAEIDRLRQELNHCLHLDHHNAIVAKRDAEIVRLRELLRDVLTDFDGYLGESLTRRVHEALGE